MKIKAIIQKNEYLNRKYIEYKWRERKVSYGHENSDLIFYVIRRTPCSIGLFSYVSTVMGHIKYAVDRGYIPVVDMQNYANTYLDDEILGKQNAWEYYFKQPMGYSLEDIKKSKNIILSWAESTEIQPDYSMVTNESLYKMWCDYSKKYLHLSDEFKSYYQEKYHGFFNRDATIGVLCRGTDYVSNHPPDHPIQPTIEQLIAGIREYLNEEDNKYVYLATEDEQVYTRFYDEFAEKLTAIETTRYQNTGNSNINELSFSEGKNRRLQGMEYLATIVLLSECKCLVAGCSGGTYGALLLSQGQQEKNIFFNGCY